MNRRLFSLLFILFVVFVNNAQSIEVEGNVTNQLAVPIPNVNITVKVLANNSIIQYGTTNDQGYYKLKFNTKEAKVLVKVSHIYYKTVIDTLVLKVKNKYTITLNESSISLNEVVVESKKLKDTMRIKTDSLHLTQRSTLRDILSKTDGFNISSEGGISFRGKQINKVLINKKEVFINQNKIALDNLDYQIMNNLELINNYKDQFNVSFESKVESVLNVNTKKEFKGVLKTSTEAAYGFVDRYLAKGKGLFFSDQLNVFVTTNTNTIGKKDFSFEDVAAAFKNNSSAFFKENFTPFFHEDDLLKTAFDSNTSVTLRKETNQNKIGFVFYYNSVDFVKTNNNLVQNIHNEVFKQETLETSNHGNSILANLVLAHKINKNSLLLFSSDIAATSLSKSGMNQVENFYPQQNSTSEKNIFDTASFLLNNELSVKSRINQGTIVVFGLQNNFENSRQDFESNFFITTPLYSKQGFNFKNNYWKLYGECNKKINDYSSITTLLKSTIANESLQVKEDLKRDIINNELSLDYTYNNNNGFEIAAYAAPQMYHFLTKNSSNNNYLFKAKGSVSYALSQNKTVRFDYTQDNNSIDLYKNIDTLKLSFNHRLINEKPLLETISKYRELSLGYYYASIIKGKSFSINTTLSESTNYLQPVLNSIVNNVFYYTNRLLDKKQDANFSVGASKHYYLTKQYHLLNFSGNYLYNWAKIPTFIASELKKYMTESQSLKATIGFEPKKLFFTEITFSTTLNKQKLFLEDTTINALHTMLYELSIHRKKDNFEFSIAIGKKVNKTNDFTFEIPFLNANTTLKITDKLNVFIKGKYLFHLLKTPNTDKTNLSIISDGNLINSNYNQNNINYLLLGLNYKF
jgi:hypothetical protein